MITKAQALQLTSRDELHAGECIDTIGPRGGRTTKRETWRVNGACKVWKTRPEEFSVPLKYGFKGPYGYLDRSNAALFHLASECTPTVKVTHAAVKENLLRGLSGDAARYDGVQARIETDFQKTRQ